MNPQNKPIRMKVSWTLNRNMSKPFSDLEKYPQRNGLDRAGESIGKQIWT